MTSKWTLVLMILGIIVLHTYRVLETSRTGEKIYKLKASKVILATKKGDSIIIIPGKRIFMKDNLLNPLNLSWLKPGI